MAVARCKSAILDPGRGAEEGGTTLSPVAPWQPYAEPKSCQCSKFLLLQVDCSTWFATLHRSTSRTVLTLHFLCNHKQLPLIWHGEWHERQNNRASGLRLCTQYAPAVCEPEGAALLPAAMFIMLCMASGDMLAIILLAVCNISGDICIPTACKRAPVNCLVSSVCILASCACVNDKCRLWNQAASCTSALEAQIQQDSLLANMKHSDAFLSGYWSCTYRFTSMTYNAGTNKLSSIGLIMCSVKSCRYTSPSQHNFEHHIID